MITLEEFRAGPIGFTVPVTEIGGTGTISAILVTSRRVTLSPPPPTP